MTAHSIEYIAEKQRDIDTEAHHALAEITRDMPTLLEEFMTDDETFLAWIGDALIQHDDKDMAAMRPLLDGQDDAELGRYVRGLVMAYMTTASKEAE